MSPYNKSFGMTLKCFCLVFCLKNRERIKKRKKYFSLGCHQMLIKSLINSDGDGLTFLSLAHNFNQGFLFW